MQIDLSSKERHVLVRILSSYYSTLREEIYKTETPAAKDSLKEEEEIVKALVDRVKNAG